jgi:small subunit ribosomal protein S18
MAKQYVDYKNVEYLKKFLNPHARIQGKRRTSTSATRQRQIALAVKRARFMALLPYVGR